MVDIVDETSFNDKINGSPCVLVDFFTSWCQPCKVLKAMLVDISNDHPDIPILTVDIDMIPALAEKYHIAAVPTVIMFENGEPVADRLVGLPVKRDIEQLIEGVS